MNDLPKRPKFYLHRSRRFWGGLGFLVFLLGCWACAVQTVSIVSYQKDYAFAFDRVESPAAYTPDGPNYFMTSFYCLSQEQGCLVIYVWKAEQPSERGHPMPGRWEGACRMADSSEEQPIRWSPAWIQKNVEMYETDRLYLPIWPLIALWAILWPVWIRRGDKLEEKRFLKLQRAHNP